jgi:hypothetical protein
MNRAAPATAAATPIKATVAGPRKLGMEPAVMLVLLLAALSLLLHGVFAPGQTLFSNDGPLGRLMAQCHQLPGRFTGCWSDLNSVGFSSGTATPGITMDLQFLLKPVWFSKLYALLSLVILGMGAWCFFVQLRLAPLACLLGGLAAALNSCFFSVACWGVAAHAATAGMGFFALAALADTTSRLRWWRVALAGFAVGMGVIEGSDVGAIYSLFVTVFVFYQAWLGGGPPAQRAAAGLGRVALVALCAGFIAAQAVVALVDTSIRGVAGAQQDEETKETRWGWATQWSLPPRELAAVVVPGLFGYRMDTPAGGAYWGESGRAPAVDEFLRNGRHGKAPTGLIRQTGGGNYAGVLVVMLACWALLQVLRGRNSVFSPAQRQWLWFWLAVAVAAVLLSFGHYAPFYRLLYALPYFSTIRNPTKFLYLVSFSLVVIFAYAIDGLWRGYLRPAAPVAAPSAGRQKVAPPKTSHPARSWLSGCAVVLGASLLAWLRYASAHEALADYLNTVGFKDARADAVASFSIRQVGWFVLFFALSGSLVAGILSGALAGARAKWGGVLLGLLLFADLGRANLPWVVYWNYPAKYASNPIIELLRDHAYEHRVSCVALTTQLPPEVPSLSKLFRYEWLAQQFPFYNIQTLDNVDMPRKPVDFKAYTDQLAAQQKAVGAPAYVRYWQLTGTDHLLEPADALERLQASSGQPGQPFHIVKRFDLVPKPGTTDPADYQNLTAAINDNGVYALLEFTGALPRAKLFANWRTDPDDKDVLQQLFSADFDPAQSVLVSGGLPESVRSATGHENAGTVTYASYTPKDIVLKCDAPAPSVLLFNDHFDPDWKVRVDGRPETLLRCNFIMRGVWLAPGAHTVEFQFQPEFRLLYVTLTGIGAALLVLTGVLVPSRRPARLDSPAKP